MFLLSPKTQGPGSELWVAPPPPHGPLPLRTIFKFSHCYLLEKMLQLFGCFQNPSNAHRTGLLKSSTHGDAGSCREDHVAWAMGPLRASKLPWF